MLSISLQLFYQVNMTLHFLNDIEDAELTWKSKIMKNHQFALFDS